MYTPLDSGLRRNDGKGDTGLRRAATGLLGGLFQTPLYPLPLRPVGVPSRRLQDFLPINDEGGCGQTFIRHGKGAAGLATRQEILIQSEFPQASAERACSSSACLSALALRAVAISTRTNLIDVLGCNWPMRSMSAEMTAPMVK